MTNILKQLTQRDDLHLLTMLPWKEVIAAMRLLRHVRTWCPKCYEHWRTTNQPLYEPLIWNFNVVTICPHHHQVLLQHCPHCSQTSRLLTSHSLPAGYCSKCGGWLVTTSESQNTLETLPKQELKWQCWVADNVGELLAKTPNLFSSIPKTRIEAVLSAYVEQVTDGNINAFCRLIQQPDSTVHIWFSGKGVPQLAQLLQICYPLQISLWNFLTQPIEVIPFNTLRSTLPQPNQPNQPKPGKRLNAAIAQVALQAALNEVPPPSQKEVVKRLNTNRTTLRRRFPDLFRAISSRYANYHKEQQYEAIRQQLETIIGKEDPPPSLREVARRLNTSIDRLPRYCLNLCSRISERYLSYHRSLIEQTQEDIQQQIRLLALELHSQGINPTSGAVGQRLPYPAVFKKKMAQEALQKVRWELGY